ncbi:hypothetical protein Bca101_067271 [Brassica carinata]
MSPLSSLICKGGSSSSARRNPDPEKEEEIIQIPACDLSMVAERFKRTLIGVPVHFWNDGTFEEIAKALGRREAIDATNARIQVAINADNPLQMERKVGFPNGDIGKVQLTYEGLNRYCFGCNRVSHDIYSCPHISGEVREQKIKELREQSSTGTSLQQRQVGALGSTRNFQGTNKRPRSPTSDTMERAAPRSYHPGDSRVDKRVKTKENYWNSRHYGEERYVSKDLHRRGDENLRQTVRSSQKENVWKRLENQTMRRSEDYQDRRYQERSTRHQGDEAPNSKNRSKPLLSQHSQQAWRPRQYLTEEKSNDQSRTASIQRNQRHLSPEKSDSQITVSVGPQRRTGAEGQRNGVLVIHRDESAEERLRCLKGKAHMTEEDRKAKSRSPKYQGPDDQAARNRGTVIIREAGNHPPKETARYDSTPDLTRNGIERSSLELEHLMESEHIENMVMTRDDEVEVDKLVDEFGDVVMTENMIQNDDLLVDEPGYDAEIIDAISQLSPANAETFDKNENIQKRGSKVSTKSKTNKLKSQIGFQDQEHPNHSDGIATSQGERNRGRSSCAEAKRGIQNSPDLKGAKASKKLSTLLIRQSPSKTKGLGVSSKPKSLKVPRIEVFPSAKSRSSVAVSGSVGSQKPPSKKI